jgi:formylglycine-generating enzyme required for sulfatase activity
MHQVYLEAFWIDRYEVTNAQYAEFLNATQGDQGRCGGHICADTKAENPDSHLLYQEGRYVAERGYDDHPVIEVSWYGAKAYCEHYGKRLPSEVEWEKAARGTDSATYPWGEKFDPHKLNSDYRVGDTTPVGSYPDGASPYGACDMAGNVWEWVADWYEAYPDSDYRSPFFGHKYKVVRGGSWNHPGDDARCARRDIAHPDRRLRVVGFRCACESPPPDGAEMKQICKNNRSQPFPMICGEDWPSRITNPRRAISPSAVVVLTSSYNSTSRPRPSLPASSKTFLATETS